MESFSRPPVYFIRDYPHKNKTGFDKMTVPPMASGHLASVEAMQLGGGALRRGSYCHFSSPHSRLYGESGQKLAVQSDSMALV
jgi:hypothetical protein